MPTVNTGFDHRLANGQQSVSVHSLERSDTVGMATMPVDTLDESDTVRFMSAVVNGETIPLEDCILRISGNIELLFPQAWGPGPPGLGAQDKHNVG